MSDNLGPLTGFFSPAMASIFTTFLDVIKTATVNACDCETCMLVRAMAGAMDDGIRSDG